MRKLLLTVGFAISALSAMAIEPYRTFDLTPADATSGEKATLELFLAKRSDTRGAIILCPGGGYEWLSTQAEGYNWVEWFTSRGIATAVLNYRIPQGRHSVPLADCSAAIDALRTEGEKYNIPADKIGVMGFSAGGHLASTMATHYTDNTRPDFQVLWYPVITMDPAYAHSGSRISLIGSNPSPELVELYSNELQVKEGNPPAFIFTCQDDGSVSPVNSLLYFDALKTNKVPAEMHFYPKGGHGFAMESWFTYREQMLHLLESWIDKTIYNNIESAIVTPEADKTAEITVNGNSIIITTDDAAGKISVWGIDGQQIAISQTDNRSFTTPALTAGIYIVRAGNLTEKMLIK